MSGKTIYTAAGDSPGPKSIGEFFDLATQAGAKGTSYFGYGQVSDKEAQRMKKDIGLDVGGAARFINEQYIRHAMVAHGEHGETRKGQVPITKTDIENIPEYIRTADKISLEGKTRQGLIVIRYQKRVNGHIVILEECRKRNKVLDFRTMWKYEAG